MQQKIEHPGRLLADLVLAPSGLSQSAAARRLGFNQPQPVNELVKGKRSITPKMALLLERATEGNYPAEFWLLAQMRWDIEQARYDIPRTRLAMVERIYERASLPMTDTAKRELGSYLENHPRGKHGQVTYHLREDFGVEPAVLRQAFDFYFERFDVRIEVD